MRKNGSWWKYRLAVLCIVMATQASQISFNFFKAYKIYSDFKKIEGQYGISFKPQKIR